MAEFHNKRYSEVIVHPQDEGMYKVETDEHEWNIDIVKLEEDIICIPTKIRFKGARFICYSYKTGSLIGEIIPRPSLQSPK